MAGPWTRVRAPVRPLPLTSDLALPAVHPGLFRRRGVPHPVAVPLARVVSAREAPTALSPAGPGLGGVAGPVCRLVAAQAGHRHRVLAVGAVQRLHLGAGTPLLPRDRGFGSVGVHRHLDLVVAGRWAGVAAGHLAIAHLLAGRARTKMTPVGQMKKIVEKKLKLIFSLPPVRLPLLVVAFRWLFALLPAPWRLRGFLPPARHQQPASAAVAGHLLGLVARVTGPLVAPGGALVVLAAQVPSAPLLARRTFAVAALAVARVLAAVTLPLALQVADVLLRATDLEI